MIILRKDILRLIALLIGALGTTLLFRQSDLNRLEATYLIGAYVHMSLQLLYVNGGRLVIVSKFLSFVLVCALAQVMMMQSNETGIVLGLAHFWYIVFCLGLEYRSRSSLYWQLIIATTLLWVPTLSIRLIGDFGSTNHFIDVPHFALIALGTSTSVGLVGIFMSVKEALNQDVTIEKGKATLDWFSTLINLVSHNLRTPMASIQGNLDILALKHAEIKDSVEFSRLENAIDVSVGTLNRLLKASFLTETSEEKDIKSTILKTYPTVQVTGTLQGKLSYSEQVSIQLALEVFIDNALSYGEGSVRVIIKDQTISVQDEGPGIDEKLLRSFGSLKHNSVGTLHGIGVPFASRLLSSVGYSINAQNTYPGFLVRIHPADIL